MSVYDLLTEEDKNKIIKYIRAYAPLTDSSSIPNIEDLPNILREWDKEKSKNLIKLFGGQLILNRPYTYSTTDEILYKEIEEELEDYESSKIYYDFKQWVRKTVCAYENNYPSDMNYLTYELFDPHCLAANAYDGESKKIIFEDGTVWKIQKGIKPMKVFTKIVERSGDEEARQLCEDFRIWHSQLLNQIRLDGTLSLSIHPLDYMTMSDNGGSWTSCMCWMGENNGDGEPGDYRAGTVECMNSPYIIVAYLHNPKKKFKFWEGWNHEEALEWNKKKWRELFIVQNGLITEIKGYPYQDENLTNTALMWIKELAQKNLGWEYNDTEVNINDEYKENDDEINLFRIRSGYYMYNDIGTLNLHRARVNIRDLYKRAENNDDVKYDQYFPRGQKKASTIFNLRYGGKATCMCCGAKIKDLENRSNSVLCSDCERTQICPCCGEYFEGEGYIISSYEDPICWTCYDYECENDDLTDEREYHGSLIELRFCLGFKEDGTPVFYDEPIFTLNPFDYINFEYQRLFSEAPKCYKNSESIWDSGILYVTMDMIKDFDWFKEVFRINSTYEELLDEYGLMPELSEDKEETK